MALLVATQSRSHRWMALGCHGWHWPPAVTTGLGAGMTQKWSKVVILGTFWSKLAIQVREIREHFRNSYSQISIIANLLKRPYGDKGPGQERS